MISLTLISSSSSSFKRLFFLSLIKMLTAFSQQHNVDNQSTAQYCFLGPILLHSIVFLDLSYCTVLFLRPILLHSIVFLGLSYCTVLFSWTYPTAQYCFLGPILLHSIIFLFFFQDGTGSDRLRRKPGCYVRQQGGFMITCSCTT